MTSKSTDSIGNSMFLINERLAIPYAELEFSYARSSGPGGQNVNKVNSKAILRWKILENTTIPAWIRSRLSTRHPSHVTLAGEFIVTSQKYRDQDKNRQDCLEKLASWLVNAAHLDPPRRPTKPSRGSIERRLTEKKNQSRRKNLRKNRDIDSD